MINGLRQIGAVQLKRWSLWGILLLGLAMTGTFSVFLLEGSLIDSLARFDPFLQVLAPAVQLDTEQATRLIRRYLVLGGLYNFQFIGLVLTALILLDDPLMKPGTRSLFVTFPCSRLSLYALQSVIPLGVLAVMLLPLWGIALINCLYAGVAVGPFLLGSLMYSIKLLVFFGVTRLCQELFSHEFSVMTSLMFFVLAHLDGVYRTVSSSGGAPWNGIAWVVSVLFPPLDRLGPSVVPIYSGESLLFIRDMLHVVLWIVGSIILAGWLFIRADVAGPRGTGISG